MNYESLMAASGPVARVVRPRGDVLQGQLAKRPSANVISFLSVGRGQVGQGNAWPIRKEVASVAQKKKEAEQKSRNQISYYSSFASGQKGAVHPLLQNPRFL